MVLLWTIFFINIMCVIQFPYVFFITVHPATPESVDHSTLLQDVIFVLWVHNNTICCVGEHFPIHLKNPLFMTRQKLVFKNKIYSVMEKIGPQCHIYGNQTEWETYMLQWYTFQYSLQKAYTYRTVPVLGQPPQHHQWIQCLQPTVTQVPNVFAPTNSYWNRKTSTSMWYSAGTITLTGLSTSSKQKLTSNSVNKKGLNNINLHRDTNKNNKDKASICKKEVLFSDTDVTNQVVPCNI